MSCGNVYFLYKESGDTSFQAIHKLKKAYGLKKVGHCGTLDKFAEGLLIVLSGNATKLAAAITGLSKTYVADIAFGCETVTLDPSGEICRSGEIPDEKTIRQVFQGWLSEIRECAGLLQQVPPAFSAIHSGGKRLYQRVLSGEDMSDLEAREVVLYSCEIICWQAPVLRVKLHCSKGFYVRSFARDLGRRCGSAAYLRSLLRSSIATVTIEQAQKLGEKPIPKNVVDVLLKLRCDLNIDIWQVGKEGFYARPDYAIEDQNSEGRIAPEERAALLRGQVPRGIYRYANMTYPNLAVGEPPKEFAVLEQNSLIGLFRCQAQVSREGQTVLSVRFWHNFSNF